MLQPLVSLLRAVAFLAATLLLLPASGRTALQEAPVVTPGDGTLRLERLRSFQAEYEQLGHRFVVRLARVGDEEPAWSLVMITEGPTGVAVDHLGHDAEELAFRYRRFAFGAFGDEYLDVTAGEGLLTVRRMPREGVAAAPAPAEVALDQPVFDGTALYWWLGLAPMEVGRSWRFRTWSPTADGATVRVSGALTVTEADDITSRDGRRWRAWAVSADTPQGELRSWVTPEPPFLIRQEVVSPHGTVTPVVTLVALRSE